jgi:hypothetical protein
VSSENNIFFDVFDLIPFLIYISYESKGSDFTPTPCDERGDDVNIHQMNLLDNVMCIITYVIDISTIVLGPESINNNALVYLFYEHFKCNARKKILTFI